MDPDAPLSPQDPMCLPEWSSADGMPTSSAPPGAVMPPVLSTEYGGFEGYGSSLPLTYHDRNYPYRQDGLPSHASMAQPAAPAPGPAGDFPHHVKAEAEPSYGGGLAMPHYPSPPSPADYTYPPSSTPYADHASGYLPDEWNSRDPLYYPAVSSGSSSTTVPAPASASSSTFPPDPAAGQPGVGSKASRKAPRRLTTKEEANFQCQVPGCGRLFNRSYNFRAHQETHDENREYPFACPVDGCAKRFVRKTDLQRHHHSVHAKEKNHKCDYCGRPFARRDTLRRHMDDGCPKRFDVGTLDLGPDGYGAFAQDTRLGGPQAEAPLMGPPGTAFPAGNSSSSNLPYNYPPAPVSPHGGGVFGSNMEPSSAEQQRFRRGRRSG